MTKILNHINTYADLTAYNNDMEKDYPNISYIQGTDEVKWEKYNPEHIVCKYNVTSTESATKLLNATTYISYQVIDGIKQDTFQMNYTFDTLGEHIVEYKFNYKYIGNNFSGCISLTSVTIPNSVTTIYDNTFDGCTGLTSITIPSSVTSIGNGVFNSCTGLTSITIPDSVTSIGSSAFERCSGLTSVTIGSGVTSIGTYAFNGCINLTNIVVDSGNTKYDSRDNCNAIIETSTNTLIKGCNTTVIPDTVTIIYNKAFADTTFKNVTIGDNVTKLNNEAFLDMRDLEGVTIGSGVTSIGNKAFGMTNVYSKTKLTSITIYATTPPTLGGGLTTSRYGLTPTIYVPAESLEAYKNASNWKNYANYFQTISE